MKSKEEIYKYYKEKCEEIYKKNKDYDFKADGDEEKEIQKLNEEVEEMLNSLLNER